MWSYIHKTCVVQLLLLSSSINIQKDQFLVYEENNGKKLLLFLCLIYIKVVLIGYNNIGKRVCRKMELKQRGWKTLFQPWCLEVMHYIEKQYKWYYTIKTIYICLKDSELRETLTRRGNWLTILPLILRCAFKFYV